MYNIVTNSFFRCKTGFIAEQNSLPEASQLLQDASSDKRFQAISLVSTTLPCNLLKQKYGVSGAICNNADIISGKYLVTGSHNYNCV